MATRNCRLCKKDFTVCPDCLSRDCACEFTDEELDMLSPVDDTICDDCERLPLSHRERLERAGWTIGADGIARKDFNPRRVHD